MYILYIFMGLVDIIKDTGSKLLLGATLLGILGTGCSRTNK